MNSGIVEETRNGQVPPISVIWKWREAQSWQESKSSVLIGALKM